MEKEIIELFITLPKCSIAIIGFMGSCLLGLIIYAGRNYFIASRELRDTFYRELEGLYPTPTKWPDPEHKILYVLKEKFPRLEVAVHKFSEYLPCGIRSRFYSAWEKYNKDYYEYVPMQGESYSYGKLTEKHDTTKTYKDNFKKNVDAILRFARPS